LALIFENTTLWGYDPYSPVAATTTSCACGNFNNTVCAHAGTYMHACLYSLWLFIWKMGNSVLLMRA